jgi:ferric-dicitrate binding protein FerR (iron transport regulator)
MAPAPQGYQSGAMHAMAHMPTELALPRLDAAASMGAPQPAKPRRWILVVSIVMVLLAAVCLAAAVWLRTRGLQPPF